MDKTRKSTGLNVTTDSEQMIKEYNKPNTHNWSTTYKGAYRLRNIRMEILTTGVSCNPQTNAVV